MKNPIRALIAAAILVLGGVGANITATAAHADTVICEQFGSTTLGNYVVMNNRWGSNSPQCINVTSTGFSIIQQDGMGNLSGAPVSYPAIYLGCHYSNCSPSSPLPKQISTIGSANTSISLTYPGSGTYDAAYDIWLNADTNVTGVQDTEIMVWLNHTGSIQPIGSQTGTANIGGRSWAVWTGNNGSNNVVSYVNAGITNITFDVMAFVRDTLGRGSQYGNNNWFLTSIQAGFEPWIGGVGLAVNSFSATIGGGNSDTQAPSTPGTPTASGTTSNSTNLSWGASSDNVGVTGYDVLRATGASGGTFTQVGTSTSTSFAATGLSANTTYRFQVRARDAAGNTSAASNAVTVTTTSGGGGDTQAPSTPGTPSASGTTSSSTNLSWGASSDNVGVTGYDVLRATGASGGTFTQVGTSTSTSFAATGLSANTTYRFQVRARDAAGNTSAASNAVTVTTTGGGTGGGCSVVATTQTQWQGGYVIQPVRITNTGSSPITNWTVTFTVPSGQTITNLWNGTLTVSGGTATVHNNTSNPIAAGGTYEFGFQATRGNSDTSLPSGYTCTSP
ncbi:fibronectin type III domain-containing protein [Streptosporangiaceae bacterium NEAU-GS5]|nr:fibronectin type III domain-containing protein [Streptosporangiaceae bacterium NEAU-GS5]